MPDLPTGTVTFLFTDVEGSTRLLEQLGSGYAEALAEHRRVVREAVERHGGVEVDTQGDAFFVAFERPSDALAAAEEAQRALALPVRMGIHTGEAELTDEGYVGMEVHRAARICAAAHGDQVVLSDRALVGGVSVKDLGLHRLKDLGDPVRLYQLGEAEFPPLRSLNATNLPAQPSPLVGRQRELGDVTDLVRGHRLVTLTGPGGTGKTRLALQAVAELVEEFPDGVFWVPLAALRDADLVVPTIEQTLGADVSLAEHVDEKRMLLLLDNLEQVVGCAPALAEVLSRCPNLKLVTTSRVVLRVQGEREYQVPPLPDSDALALFRERAIVAEPEEAVREICRRLDGLPLAIELAAARTRLLPPDKLLPRLERALPVLTGGARDAPERQRTLRATIEWSYDLLPREEQQLFRRLAVFASSFTVEAAEAVCDADLDTLESLLEKSLLRRWGSGRLGMLETIREYAAELLEVSGEGDTFRSRLVDRLTVLARSANLVVEASGPMRHDLVVPEGGNIRAALEWTVEQGLGERGLGLALALENYWVSAGDADEGARWVRSLLALGPSDPELSALAVRALGNCAAIQGRRGEAVALYEQSTEAFRELGDELRIAVGLFRMASNLPSEEDDRRKELTQGALEYFRRTRFVKGELQCLSLFGHLEHRAGHPERALELFTESVALCRETGSAWWEINVHLSMAEIYFELQRIQDASAAAAAALGVATRISDRRGELHALALLAAAAARCGDETAAGRLWGAIEADIERSRLGGWKEETEPEVTALRGEVSGEFEAARAEGKKLTLAEAVELPLSYA